MKTKTGKKHYLNDSSLKAIWQGRIKFSPLTETAFNQEPNLSENSVSAIAVTESWGGSDLGRNPLDRGGFAEDLNRQEVHESLSSKGGMHFSVSFFSRYVRVSPVKMQSFSFLISCSSDFLLFIQQRG